MQESMKSFAMSHEDAQDKDQWRLKIKGNWIYLEYGC